MFAKLRQLFRQIVCRHDYIKIGWQEAEERNIRYSIRHYTCTKCGKQTLQDGRYDPYQK